VGQRSSRVGAKAVKHTMDSGNSQAKKARRDDPRGDKGTYRKVTVTLPPDAYECLVRECAYRKIAGKPNHLVSAVVREALIEYLGASNGNAPKKKMDRLTGG